MITSVAILLASICTAETDEFDPKSINILENPNEEKEKSCKSNDTEEKKYF
jgi:hypothetical protein